MNHVSKTFEEQFRKMESISNEPNQRRETRTAAMEMDDGSILMFNSNGDVIALPSSEKKTSAANQNRRKSKRTKNKEVNWLVLC